MANKESMIFYNEWRKAVEKLSTEQRCRTYEAIFDYAFAGIEPQDAIINAITSIMRTRINKDREAYENICEKNRANIRKRWEKIKKQPPKQADTVVFDGIPENTVVYDGVRGDTKNTYNDNYTDHDVANATTITPANAGASARADEASAAKREKVNFEALLKFYNAEMDKANAIIPRAKNISGQRLILLKARIREYGKEAVADVIRKAARSNFLNGGGSKGFKIDFTWIVRPENFLKILEGKFDNDSPQNLTSQTSRNNDPAEIYSNGNAGYAARQQEFAQHIEARLSGAYDDEPDVSGDY